MSPAKKTGGVSDAFKPEVDGKKYATRLETLLDAKILEQWERIGKGKADLRKDAASKRRIYLQLFKGKTEDGTRVALWRMFMTLVHEYIHTLEHSQWRAWRDAETKKDKSKGQTLLEGVTEFLTRVVLSDVNPKDEALRKGVEGTHYDEDAAPPDLKRTGYQADADRAEKMVGVVGGSNLYNAYFVGQTQFLGG